MSLLQGWTVRPAGLNDAQALSLVGSATFLETFAGILDGNAIIGHCVRQHSKECYAAYLTGGAKAWLAESQQGQAPIGFALLTAPDLPGAEENDIELKRIYALSRFHGSGLGAALMTAALEAAKDYGRLVLGVYRGNTRAISFYRKQGFEPIGERQFEVGSTFYEDVVFARVIPSQLPHQKMQGLDKLSPNGL